MENLSWSVLVQNQFMKKEILVAIAIFTGSIAFAQQKKAKQPPPPPPPPEVNMEKFVPPPPPPPRPNTPPPPKVVMERFSSPNNADYQAFLKRNPAVKSVGWSENKIRIHLKSGKEEVYNTSNEAETQKLKDKYGELPAPPPPPPPPRKPKRITEA